MQENVLAGISEYLTIPFTFSFLYDSIFCNYTALFSNSKERS